MGAFLIKWLENHIDDQQLPMEFANQIYRGEQTPLKYSNLTILLEMPTVADGE